MIVVDSSGWIEYFVRSELAKEYSQRIADLDKIVTPSIVLYEVFKKILRDGDERSAVDAVAHIRQTRIVPLSADLAIAAAEWSLEYRLAMADAVVYATARSCDATLVTSDVHFEGLPGVIYIPRPQ